MFEMLLFYTVFAFGVCWGIGGSPLTLPFRKRLAYYAGESNLVEDGATETAAAPSPLNRGAELTLRFFLHLVECPACLGFWLAFAVAAAIPDFAGELPLAPGSAALRALSLAFYTAGANYLLGRATGLIDKP